MLEGLTRDKREPQYFGGAAGRAAAIEAGAGRSATELVDDVRLSGSRLDKTLRTLPAPCWTDELVGGVPATKILVSRWREIEIHRVDLDLGYPSTAWSAEFVAYYLPQELAKLETRAPGVDVPSGLPDHAVLAWLVGRGGPELPELPAWA
jgi:maleylpyruvate isomerase